MRRTFTSSGKHQIRPVENADHVLALDTIERLVCHVQNTAKDYMAKGAKDYRFRNATLDDISTWNQA